MNKNLITHYSVTPEPSSDLLIETCWKAVLAALVLLFIIWPRDSKPVEIQQPNQSISFASVTPLRSNPVRPSISQYGHIQHESELSDSQLENLAEAGILSDSRAEDMAEDLGLIQ